MKVNNKIGFNKRGLAILFLFVIILTLISVIVKGRLDGNEIRNNGSTTICKYVLCKRYPKTTSSFFKYYVNDVSYKNSYGRCPRGKDYQEKINKFFIVSYSNLDPNKIRVDFSREVKDTVAILKAGFKLEDI